MPRNAHRITKRLPTLPGVTTLAASSSAMAASWVAIAGASRAYARKVADHLQTIVMSNRVNAPAVEPEPEHSASDLSGLLLVLCPRSHPLLAHSGMVVPFVHCQFSALRAAIHANATDTASVASSLSVLRAAARSSGSAL